MATNKNIQPPTEILRAVSQDGKVTNKDILLRFDTDLRIMYEKIVELEKRIVALGG